MLASVLLLLLKLVHFKFRDELIHGPPRGGPPLRGADDMIIRDDIARQNEFILRQQAELELRRGELLRVRYFYVVLRRLSPYHNS